MITYFINILFSVKTIVNRAFKFCEYKKELINDGVFIGILDFFIRNKQMLIEKIDSACISNKKLVKININCYISNILIYPLPPPRIYVTFVDKIK